MVSGVPLPRGGYEVRRRSCSNTRPDRVRPQTTRETAARWTIPRQPAMASRTRCGSRTSTSSLPLPRRSNPVTSFSRASSAARRARPTNPSEPVISIRPSMREPRGKARAPGPCGPGTTSAASTLSRLSGFAVRGRSRATFPPSPPPVGVVLRIELARAVVDRGLRSVVAAASVASGSGRGCRHRRILQFAGPTETIVPSAGYPEVAWRNGVLAQTRSRSTRVSGQLPTLPYVPNPPRQSATGHPPPPVHGCERR